MLLDVGGQDATEAFEDVGHSDEAREILEGLLVGKLKRKVFPQPQLSEDLPLSSTVLHRPLSFPISTAVIGREPRNRSAVRSSAHL